MKPKFLFFALAFSFAAGAFGQEISLELTFSAIDNASYIQLDSIEITNQTQGGDTVLFWPDTVLVIGDPVGTPEISESSDGFEVFPNYPNPVKDQTIITVYVPEKDNVTIMISDIMGREVINNDWVFARGYHSFRFAPGGGQVFFFTAFSKGTGSSIRIIKSSSTAGQTASLEYIGTDFRKPQLKATMAIEGFEFNVGDELFYKGFAGDLQSSLVDSPEASTTYTLQFAMDIPCPGMPTVTYEGQTYNTVQIYNQCWIKENLNVGNMVPGTQEMTDDGTIEKYCYDNNTANCDTFGALYQWNEMMQYSTTPGARGICPQGWHVPADAEWCMLENQVDADTVSCTEIGWRGIDAGGNLKEDGQVYWFAPNTGATNSSGFTALPGGYRNLTVGTFHDLSDLANFWTSNENGTIASNRNLWSGSAQTFLGISIFGYGYSVRCVKD